jgi:Tol biopolymer transport system component
MRVWLAMACSAAICLLAGPLASAAVTGTERVSVSSDEDQAVGHSGIVAENWGESVALSADGRFVAFTSQASNLVSGDTNGFCDVFVRDRMLGQTKRVSISSAETQGNRSSCFGLALSANGRFVAFGSRASNLVRGDTNGTTDVFVRDRALGGTRRVSLRADDRQRAGASVDPAMSASGRLVAFTSTPRIRPGLSPVSDVYLRDRRLGTTRRVSVSSGGARGDDSSFDPAVSADGEIVAFSSAARNFVRPDANLDNPDVFIRLLAAGRTRRVSVDSDEHQLLGCSNGGSFHPVLDQTGSQIAFTWIDGNCVYEHVMLRDRSVGTTQQLDQGMGATQPDGLSEASGISTDGAVVSFDSSASNLVPDDTNGDPEDPFFGSDVFTVDVGTGATTRVSVSDVGAQAEGTSGGSAMSANAGFVAFISNATNLVAGDTNARNDVFMRGPL